MSFHAKMYVAIAVAVLAIGSVGFASWLSEHDARLKGEAEIKAAKAAYDKVQEGRKIEAAAEADRDRQTADRNASTLAEVVKIKTPAQVSDYVNREIPGASAVVTTPARPPDAKPDAPAPAPLVTVDAEALDNRLAACKIAENNLSGCKADLAGRDHDRQLADEQIALLKKETGRLESLAGQTKWSKAWNGWIKPGLAFIAGVAGGRLSKK